MNVVDPIVAAHTDHTHNVEVERAILAVILDGRHVTAWDIALETIQTPLAFYERNHRIAFLACMTLAAEGARVDAQAVAECLAAMEFGSAIQKLRDLEGLKGKLPPLGDHERSGYEESALAAVGGFNTVSDWSTVFSPAAGLERNCKILAEHYRQRRAITVLSGAIDRLRMPQGVREVDAILDGMLNAALAQTQTGGSGSLGDGVREALTRHDQIQGGQSVKSAVFGLASLDRVACMQPGELWILAAGPGCGKTSLMLHGLTATARLHGPRSVALVSREMGRRELGAVIVARGLRCPRAQVDHGQLDAAQREVANDLAKHADELGIMVRDATGGCSVNDVGAWAIARKRLGGLAFLVIDYLQILSPTSARQDEYQRVSEASGKLKQLARDLQVPILALSQMSRDGRKAERGRGGKLKGNPEPQLSDLRGSGSIEQDADGVIFLWRPSADGNVVEAKVAKCRAGAPANDYNRDGRAELLWYPAQGQRFAEVQGHIETEPHRNTTMFTPPSADPNDEIPWETAR